MLAADSADSSIKFWRAGLFPYQKEDRLNQKVNLSKWNATKLASRLNPKTECRVACLSVCEERIRIGTEDGLTQDPGHFLKKSDYAPQMYMLSTDNKFRFVKSTFQYPKRWLTFHIYLFCLLIFTPGFLGFSRLN